MQASVLCIAIFPAGDFEENVSQPVKENGIHFQHSNCGIPGLTTTEYGTVTLLDQKSVWKEISPRF